MKDLQVQNSQFQETLLTLAKRKQELMTLLASKNKPKRKALVNMGKRFREPIRQMPIVEESSEEHENQAEEARSTWAGLSMIECPMMKTILMSSILLPMISTSS